MTQDNSVTLSARVSISTAESIDALIQRRQQEKPWLHLSRGDIMREALFELLRKELAEKKEK